MLQLATVVDTTVSQQISDQPKAVEQEFVFKPYSELRVGDEINAYCGKKYQRCKILQRLDDGEFIRFTLSLATRSFSRDIVKTRFLSTATAEVYRERTPTPKQLLELHQEWLLEIIQPGRIYTLLELTDAIAARLGRRTTKYNISKAGKALVKQKRLYQRKVGTSVGFRAPLPREAGFPVVEFAGKPSEKLGWIAGWRYFHATKSLQPVVHYLDGFEGFSNEERLDPATGGQARRIEVARLRFEGKSVEGVVEISDLLLLELREGWGERKTRNEVMAHIARLLGFLKPHDTDFVGIKKAEAWNKTLTYLETYYPDWQQGMSVRRAG